MRQTQFALVSLFVAFAVQACNSDPDLSPSAEMKIGKTCLESVCAHKQKSAEDACFSCTSSCSSNWRCDLSRCDSICDIDSCSDSEKNTCENEGFKVTLANNPSPELLAACQREFAHIAECGYKANVTAAACANYAAVELPERAANYDCVAQLPCESLTDANALAACEPAPTTFGDEVCAQMNARCPNSCVAQVIDNTNKEGAWLRPDALAAARSCATQETCRDMGDCWAAWTHAVTGE